MMNIPISLLQFEKYGSDSVYLEYILAHCFKQRLVLSLGAPARIPGLRLIFFKNSVVMKNQNN